MADPERTIASERIFQGRVIGVRVDSVELENGKTSQREIVEHPGAVCMVPVDAEGQVLLVRQYRKAAGEWLLEIPAGTKDKPGESPEDCAQRELAEECGQRAGRIERLGGFFSAPGFCTEFLDCFLMTELEPVDAAAEDDELLSVERYPLAEAVDMVMNGTIRDAKSVSGIMMAARRLIA